MLYSKVWHVSEIDFLTFASLILACKHKYMYTVLTMTAKVRFHLVSSFSALFTGADSCCEEFLAQNGRQVRCKYMYVSLLLSNSFS